MMEDDFSYRNGYQRNTRRTVTFIPRFTIAVILLNLLIFLFTDLFGFAYQEEIVDWGALEWYSVLKQGEWYRIFTSMFLHSDMEHIGNNMFILACMGYYLEREIGSVRCGILYFGSGILAGCTSMVYNMVQNSFVVSIGASGAIFGTIGALLYIVLFFKQKEFQYSIQQVAFLVFLSLYSGFVNQEVDNAAHVGGFIAGFFIMGLLSIGLRRKKNQ
ncbi:MAG: rhomboid family intramembrane serine protease [Butyribacter sp.]|nr:rhomboid family intramembrane serine protease [bacterium]MDY3853835.1 rhomboid family intramembrane serine protease [Butyribacter sp.]